MPSQTIDGRPIAAAVDPHAQFLAFTFHRRRYGAFHADGTGALWAIRSRQRFDRFGVSQVMGDFSMEEQKRHAKKNAQKYPDGDQNLYHYVDGGVWRSFPATAA